MNKPKFTIALIARNESKTLPRLLNSLTEFRERGGEVLLLDTGSTDDTAQIALDMGCIVHEVGDKFKITIDQATAEEINQRFVSKADASIVKSEDKMFDYSSARNYIAQFSKTDIIATPDCDEIYTKLDIDAINEAIENGVDQLEYNFVYSHDENGNEAIKFTHSKFYNKFKMKWVGIIHEVLDSKEVINRKFFPENIIKLEHYQNVETNRSHYLTGLAYDCFNNPFNDRNAHYFGRELFYTHRYRSAIEQLYYHVDMKKWPAEASQSMMFIGDSYMILGQEREALNAYREAFDLCPTRREPLMKMAEYYYARKMVDQTLVYASAALQIKEGEGHFYANYQPYYENIPHEMLYWALWEKGEIGASRDHFEACYAYQPFNPKYMHDFRFYYKLPKITLITSEPVNDIIYPQELIDVMVPQDTEMPLKSFVGDWAIYVASGAILAPEAVMSAFKTAMDNRKWFMAFSDDSTFMIHRKLTEKLADESYDKENPILKISEMYKKTDQYMRCERAKLLTNNNL